MRHANGCFGTLPDDEGGRIPLSLWNKGYRAEQYALLNVLQLASLTLTVFGLALVIA